MELLYKIWATYSHPPVVHVTHKVPENEALSVDGYLGGYVEPVMLLEKCFKVLHRGHEECLGKEKVLMNLSFLF